MRAMALVGLYSRIIVFSRYLLDPTTLLGGQYRNQKLCILKLIPRIEQTLTYIHDDPVLQQPSVFAWEDEGIELTYRRELWLVPIIGSRILLPVAASITSLTAFIAVSKVRGWFMCSRYVAITVVVALIVYTMCATLAVLRDAQKRPQP